MEYRTMDIVLASTLIVSGHKLTNLEVIGSRGTFVFTNIPDELLLRFDLGEALVEPRDFNNTIKKLTTSVRRFTQRT